MYQDGAPAGLVWVRRLPDRLAALSSGESECVRAGSLGPGDSGMFPIATSASASPRGPSGVAALLQSTAYLCEPENLR